MLIGGQREKPVTGDQLKQNIFRFRLSETSIPTPNIPYDQLWLWLPAPSSDGSAPTVQCGPRETTAKLPWSNPINSWLLI